jgi:hypothetical protein
MTIGALSLSLEPLWWSLISVVAIGAAAIAWSGIRHDLLASLSTTMDLNVHSYDEDMTVGVAVLDRALGS